MIDMTKTPVTILVLCDAHIGGDGDELEHLEALIEGISVRFIPEETLIIFAGDVTDNGARGEVWAALGIMQRLEDLGYAWAVVPGNHDGAPGGWRGLDPKIRARFIRQLVMTSPVIDLDDDITPPWLINMGALRCVLLDSTAGMLEPDGLFDFARGRLGVLQLQGAHGAIVESDQIVIVILHHHPTYRKHFIRDDNALLDVEALLDVLRTAHPDVVICGHKHVAERLRIAGVSSSFAGGKCTKKTDQGYSVIAVSIEDGEVASVGECFI